MLADRALCALDVDVSSADSVTAAGARIELAHEDLVSYSLFVVLADALIDNLVLRVERTSVQGTGVAATIEDMPSSATASAMTCFVKSIVCDVWV